MYEEEETSMRRHNTNQQNYPEQPVERSKSKAKKSKKDKKKKHRRDKSRNKKRDKSKKPKKVKKESIGGQDPNYVISQIKDYDLDILENKSAPYPPL